MKKELILGILFALILFSLFPVYAQDDDLQAQLKNTATGISQQLQLSPEIQNFASNFFRVGQVSYSEFVILVVLFFLFFILFFNVLPLLPFPLLNKGVGRFLGAFIIDCLVALGGGFSYAIIIVKTILYLIIVAILLLILSFVLRIIKNKSKIDEAEEVGEKAGTGAKVIGKVAEEMFKDGGGI